MKKNLGLLALLVGLLCITYFSQEKKGILDDEKKDSYSKILDTSMYGELVELQTPFSHIKKYNDSFTNFSDGHRVDLSRVNEFLSRLSHIRATKYLKGVSPDQMKDFFPEDHMKMTFTFENETLEYQLGKQVNFSQDFYIALKTKSKGVVVALANDKLPFEGMVNKKEEHRSSHKYDRVKALFSLPVNFFLDLSIFDNEELERSIVFSNIRNESFSVDFESTTTNPPPVYPIQPSSARMSHLRNKLLSLRALNYIKNADSSKFSRKIGNIKTEKGVYTIYERYNNDQSYYIFNPKTNLYYQFKAGEQKVLLFNIQSVWDLRVVEELGANVSITFDNDETLDLEVHRLGEEASQLFKLILSPAEYIIENNKAEDARKWKLKLNIKARELEVSFTKTEIIVFDKKLNISYHYIRFNKEPVSIEPDKYRVK